MTEQSLPAGTVVETFGEAAFGVASERGVICEWTEENGQTPNYVAPSNGGWHIVRFSDGGTLCVHESRLRLA